MRVWHTQGVLAWFAQNGPPETPVRVWPKKRRVPSERNNEQGQAARVDGQFAAVWPKPLEQVLARSLFLSGTRFRKAAPWLNYTATDCVINNGGNSQWPLPAADFPVNQKY